MNGIVGTEQNLAKRASAQKAFIDADTDLKLRRALQHRARPSRGPFERNQWVMFWRAGKGNLPSNWHGPAKVVLTEGDQLVWVTHMSRLYRCAPEHLRNLSSREVSNIKPEDDSAHILPENLGSGVFQYHDLTQQSVQSQSNGSTTTPNPGTDQISAPPQTAQPNEQNNGSEGSDVQPDSEPDQASEPPQLTEPTDVSQIPVPDAPFSEEEETEIVADTLRAESQVFDHWIVKGKKVIRVHQEPRLHLFHPNLVTDCPVEPSRLSTVRKSIIRIPGQPETVLKEG